MAICDNQSIRIIELKEAQNDFIGLFNLKREMDIVTGMFATAFIPINGEVHLNGFREEGQFKFGLLSLKFNDCQTVYNVPVHFINIQGYMPDEEGNANYNRQLTFIPTTLYKKLSPNASIKVKYRDSVSDVRFAHNIKLYLKYIDR